MENKKKKRICIFDVDGTLTESTKQITKGVLDLIKKLKEKDIEIVVVAGGSYSKVIWQLCDKNIFDKIFTECGAIYYEKGCEIYHKNFIDFCDRNILNEIIRQALIEIAKMPILFSGHQIDFRSGLVYISPVGQQAGDLERNIFIKLDKQLNIRKKLIESLKEKDYKNEFDIVLGGNVGISVYPKGWDKGQIMKYFDLKKQEIYFFGDKIEPNGNDYGIYSYPGIRGFGVKSYEDTVNYLKQLFLNNQN